MINNPRSFLKHFLIAPINYFRQKDPKIFCIGFNKTGTTSIKVLLQNCGVLVGDQRRAELLTEKFLDGDVDVLLKYCKTARAFQDTPFSFPGTYKVLDQQFPNAKFILTVRDDPEQWYRSVVNFTKKIYGKLPDSEDMMKFKYVNEGWFFRVMYKVYGDQLLDDWFRKDIRIQSYLNHNNEVMHYFENQNRLCVVNVAKKEDFKKLLGFLGLSCKLDNFPLVNKT